MKLIMTFIFLLFTHVTWGKVSLAGKIYVNKSILSINNLDVQFEKENLVIQDDFEIMYQISKKIPSKIVKKYNNKNSLLININIKKANSTVAQGQLITNYGSQAILETKNEKGLFKIEITAEKTVTAAL